jgi:hypothetical protein
MGQGGRITLVNGTPYDWRNTYHHSYQMNSWTFPETIPAGSTASVYVEWSEGIFEHKGDDAGEVTYTLGPSGANFQVQARAGNGFDLRVVLTGIATTGNPKGSTIDLGWQHDGNVTFILAGKEGSYTSSNPPAAWMQQNLGVLGGRSLRHLCIPGSHDSGMSVYTSGTAFATRCNTLTQTSGILGQLQFGVRYFDVRPVISAGQYLTGHYSNVGQIDSWQGANGQSIASIISDVNAFTATNQELVVLHLTHDLNTDVGNSSYRAFTQGEWDALLKQLQGLNHLYTAQNASVDLTTLTLNDFITGKPAVVVVVEPSAQGISLGDLAGKGFYPPASFSVYNSYSNTNDLSTMQADQLKKLAAQRPNPDAGYFVLSWTLTQDNTQAVTCALGTANSILDLANIANPAVYSALLPACTAQSYPNIIYMDGVHGSDAAALALAVTSKAIG